VTSHMQQALAAVIAVVRAIAQDGGETGSSRMALVDEVAAAIESNDLEAVRQACADYRDSARRRRIEAAVARGREAAAERAARPARRWQQRRTAATRKLEELGNGRDPAGDKRP